MKIDRDGIRREQAVLLRENGMRLQKIADVTVLPIDTVMNVCQEIIHPSSDENLHIRMGNMEACSFCGSPIEQNTGSGRPRRFCCEHCRRQYWRLHRPEQKKSPGITYVRNCRYCGRPFQSYGKNERKYCCRDHYLRHLHGEDYGKKTIGREETIKAQLSDLARLLG